jgi:hypothetical protein
MHGLQSPLLACLKYLGGPLLSPSRSKGRHLARVFPSTVAPDIRMSTYNPLAENSPARWVLPYLTAAAVATAHAATAGGGAAGCAVGAAAAAAGAAVATPRLGVLVRWRVAISLRACVTIQSAAIRREKPDIVVASSWGGAIALLCIQQGHWGGPTLLLAPALSLKGWWAKLLVQPLAWEGQQPETAAAVTQRLAAERCLVLQVGETRVLVTHSVLHSLTNAAASTCRGEPTPSWTPRPCNGGAGAPVCGASPSTAPQIVDCTDPLTVTDCHRLFCCCCCCGRCELVPGAPHDLYDALVRPGLLESFVESMAESTAAGPRVGHCGSQVGRAADSTHSTRAGSTCFSAATAAGKPRGD